MFLGIGAGLIYVDFFHFFKHRSLPCLLRKHRFSKTYLYVEFEENIDMA